MQIGKVPNSILQRIVLDKIRNNRSEVLLRPKIGEDCCAVDFGEYICVLSSDPITGAVNEVGRLAVHVTCNDIASCGVEPLGLIVTILAPQGTSETELDTVMGQLCDTANSLNVDIIGGHTEITASVSRFVVVSTAMGKIPKGNLVTTSGAVPGDDIILTKSAGIEGTAIIANDREKEIVAALGQETVIKAKSFIECISVVKEGVLAGKFGVSAMHDVTEGGVLGAAWEIGEASGQGFVIEKAKIPIAPETLAICGYYGINPLKLISSGCMLITCSRGEELVKLLYENGISASIIGKITGSKDKLLIDEWGAFEKIEQPESDELYKVIGF